MNEHAQRAAFFSDHERWDEAVRELRKALEAEDEDASVHCNLSLALTRLGRLKEGEEAARRAVSLDPEWELTYFALGMTLTEAHRLKEARAAIGTAIELGPTDASNFGALARIEFLDERWSACERTATQGLELDAEDEMCLHWRAQGLSRLGRGKEAEQDIAALLAMSPDDPYNHSNQGYACLEKGDAEGARGHFLEALRIDPSHEEARVGLVHSLNSRHKLFNWALRALLYLGRFRGANLIWLMVGAWTVLHFVGQYANQNPDYFLFVWWIRVVFYVSIYFIVTAPPVFNLILRFDKEGRRALTDDQIRASNWHALILSVSLFFALVAAWMGGRLIGIYAVVTVALILPVNEVFETNSRWARRRMSLYTLVVAAMIPLSYFAFIFGILGIALWGVNLAWLIHASVLHIPIASLLMSFFADSFHRKLTQLCPDEFANKFD